MTDSQVTADAAESQRLNSNQYSTSRVGTGFGYFLHMLSTGLSSTFVGNIQLGDADHRIGFNLLVKVSAHASKAFLYAVCRRL